MKATIKRMVCALLLCLLCSTLAMADTKETENRPIPDFCQPILEAWGATNADELRESLLQEVFRSLLPEEVRHMQKYMKSFYTSAIRLGGTTQALLKDKKWGMAIVSSREVDIQALVKKKRIQNCGFSSLTEYAYLRWIVPDAWQDVLPQKVDWDYEIGVYGYDGATDAVIMVLLSPKNCYGQQGLYALLDRRTAEEARSVEGISRVHTWSVEQLIENPADWDVAMLSVRVPDDLARLDAAGMLLDLRQDAYLANRTAPQRSYCLPLANGYFSADGRMLGFPCRYITQYEPSDTQAVVLVNARSERILPALSFAVHVAKCVDWELTPENDTAYLKPTKDELRMLELVRMESTTGESRHQARVSGRR